MGVRDALLAYEQARESALTSAGVRERWQARMKLEQSEDTSGLWEKARACGCMACPDCRPDVARTAEVVDVPFEKVLAYLVRLEELALDELVSVYGKPQTRAESRRQERRQAQVRAQKAAAPSHKGRVTLKQRALDDALTERLRSVSL